MIKRLRSVDMYCVNRPFGSFCHKKHGQWNTNCMQIVKYEPNKRDLKVCHWGTYYNNNNRCLLY